MAVSLYDLIQQRLAGLAAGGDSAAA